MQEQSKVPSAAEAYVPPFATPPLFSWSELRAGLAPLLAALRRRRALALGVLAFTLVATAAAVPVLPRRYHFEARLLALPAEGAPGVARLNGDPVGLSEGAVRAVLAHDELRAIVREQGLVERWELWTSPVHKGLDAARLALGRPRPDAAARERQMVNALEKRIEVQTAGGGQVTLSLDWPDAQSGQAVLGALVRNFLEARRQAELVPLERSAAQLQENAAQAELRTSTLGARIAAAVRARRRGAKAASVRALQADGRFRDLPDTRLSAARLELISRRKALAEREEARRKRLTELNATLADQRATLGPDNVALAETQEKIRALDAEGAALARLRAEEEALLAAYVKEGGRETELSAEPGPIWPAELKEDDPELAFDRSRLSLEEADAARLRAQAGEARNALAAAQAAFASRYRVLTPPEPPEAPAFPNAPLLLLAAALGGALAGAVAALLADRSPAARAAVPAGARPAPPTRGIEDLVAQVQGP